MVAPVLRAYGAAAGGQDARRAVDMVEDSGQRQVNHGASDPTAIGGR